MISVAVTDNFMKVRDDWGKLYEGNARLSYYQSQQMMSVLWKNLLLYRLILRISPRFYVFREDGCTVMILPLFKKWLSNGYTGYGYKAGLGYIDAVYPDNITDRTLSECFYELNQNIGKAKIDLQHVRFETGFGNWLNKNGGDLSEEGYTIIPFPEDYESYYGSLSKHMKQNLRTAYNRLKTDDGEYEFECIPYSEMKDLRKELQTLYIDRQISKYKKSRLYKYFVKYVDLGTKIQESKNIDVRAFVLRINGKIAAFYDGIFSDRGIIVPRLAITDGFDRYSPGVMLLNESIKYLIENGEKSIDLTHGTEGYKLSMGGEVHQCVECEMEMGEEMSVIPDLTIDRMYNASSSGGVRKNKR